VRVQALLRSAAERLRIAGLLRVAAPRVRGYFEREPRLGVTLGPLLLLSVVLYVRAPGTNFVFDEQEALLANPYVNGQVRVWEVFSRDFWGLPPQRTIGSYRPLPNLIWRALWPLGHTPFFAHSANLLLHGLNAAILARLVYRWTGARLWAWLAGAVLASAAILTEAVAGVVGIADVLAGTALLCGLWALEARLPLRAPLVFLAVFFGLLSKESCISALVVLPFSAWVLGPLLERDPRGAGAADSATAASAWPRRALSTLLVLAGALGALVAYTYLRRQLFSVAPGAALSPAVGEGWLERGTALFLSWFQQPKLPIDPINNPLLHADAPSRVAAALGIYVKGLVQVLVPWRLSGDYSFAEEPVPTLLVTTGSVLGALLLLGAPLVGLVLALWGGREPGARGAVRALLAWLLVWVPVTYFPHSNVLVLLPTVRAERLWYLPVLATSVGLGGLLAAAIVRARALRLVPGARARFRALAAAAALFCTVQLVQARVHASHYNSDLRFWRATVAASPDSAKAQLNYGVMLGARGRMEQRLEYTKRAIDIAPDWPMANVYYADALCRRERNDEAWPYYRRGFELGPNEANLIALGLQCLWDKGRVPALEHELAGLGAKARGSWLEFLVRDLLDNGKKYDGVQPRYRPRSYDEGPKKDAAK
jgi:tetratricopeptide (TPR) repeat protein